MANVPESARRPALPKPSLFTDLLRVSAQLTAAALSRFYAGKLPPSEWCILAALAESGTLTGRAISLQAHLHKTQVSRAIARLEQRKLIIRSVNPDDLRAPLVSLTAEGEEIYNELAPLALVFETQLLNALEPADRVALERALHRITERSRQIIRRQQSSDMTMVESSAAVGRSG